MDKHEWGHPTQPEVKFEVSEEGKRWSLDGTDLHVDAFAEIAGREILRLAEEVERLKASGSCAGCHAAGRAEGYNAALASVRRELLAEIQRLGAAIPSRSAVVEATLLVALDRVFPE